MGKDPFADVQISDADRQTHTENNSHIVHS